MIRQPHLVDAFERSQIQRRRPDFIRNLEIFEALFEEAKSLGVFPLKDPLEGVDVESRLAQVLNVQIPARKTRNRSLTPTFPT